MSDIINMMTGPQPRNHNAKREVMAAIDILRAVSGRLTTRGETCLEELEGVATTMVKVIRGIKADYNFGVLTTDEVDSLRKDVASLYEENARLCEKIAALTTPVASDAEPPVEVVAETSPAKRRGRPPRAKASEESEP